MNFETFPGGKGANQAVATSRLGATVSMIGAVGNDSHGEMLVQNLKNNNVDISNVEVLSEEVSGTAFITVVNGDNSIIFIPGANEKIDYNKIEKTLQSHEDFDMFILQNEISQNVINLVIEFAHNHNILTLYNPAPARKLDQTIIDKVSYITPNETEFSVIFPGATFEEILRKYPNKLVVTLGDKGAIYFDGKNIRKVPAKKVSTIVDTTGAGDTFNAALAVSILEGKTMQECVEFANLASSIAIQSKGAQDGMPMYNELMI